jgi:hypothetical protein
MKNVLYALVSLVSLAFALLGQPKGGEIEAHSTQVPQAALKLLVAQGH